MATRTSEPHEHDDRPARDHRRGSRQLLSHDGDDVRLQLPARPEMLRLARQVTASLADAAGLGTAQREGLEVAVSEACTNALEAQMRAGETQPVVVAWHPTPDGLMVTVADRGGGFDPGALPPRPPQDDPHHLDVERGWGLDLMRRLVDELAIERAGHGTLVRLAVRRR